ncbi:MAG: gliding motility-associated C-terminal domain-containing protein, partial [Fulvivirga sp.]|uniref:T9SS type B sorting domain-containing protein n=1 Tax=Fulvivirga sp. TaxID=1931237 RepID=UPI0032EC7F60
EDLGATVSPEPPVFQPSLPPAQLTFSWDTECLDIRDQPYSVVFKITDNPPQGPKLVSFATWNITIVGPSPDLNNVQQDGQGIRLDWSPYFCQNAELIQVWRRVDSNPYEPDECETGIRENAGYSLIAETNPTATTYRDTQLAAAAKYCYRLVAKFPDVPGGESIVSQELCFEFVPAETPIITHVTVEETSETNGEIVLAWRAPFELGTFPADPVYRIYRAEGFAGGNYQQIAEVNGLGLDSIGFRDTNLDTHGKVYNYQVALLDPTSSTGTDEIMSASASAVRLEVAPQFGRIQLDWAAVVPWSNTIISPPEDSEHLIFRGLEGQSQDQFTLLENLDVTQYGFSYTDSVNLSDEQIYCYRVLTKGTYGNPAINSPQLNFSQIICAQPSDSIAPCAPVVSLSGRTCEDFLATSSCDFNDFENQISWSTEFVGECENDVRLYEVYYSPTTIASFELIAEVTDTTFLHENLPSFKGCYQVRAVDRSGNFSEFSNTFCVDNCPNYELPNVFTPGNNDGCNDFFSAYNGGGNIIGEDGSSLGDCGVIDATKCARFVRRVEFTVYNRWGNSVYTYTGTSGTENSILINWDGTSDSGTELPSGVYYYSADVTFDLVDPSKSTKQYKGWIHLVR